MKQIVTAKSMPDVGYLGFKAGENAFTYPRPTADKVGELFRCMRELAEYVVVDCVSDDNDLMSALAKREAETVIQTVNPNLKSMTYYTSHADGFTGFADKTLIVMNLNESDVYFPVEDVKNHFKKVRCLLPYSVALKHQEITGTLSERIGDRKYREALAALARAVI
jgi:hypothetical protein